MNPQIAQLLGAVAPQANIPGITSIPGMSMIPPGALSGSSPIPPGALMGQQTPITPSGIAVANNTVQQIQQTKATGIASIQNPVRSPQSISGASGERTNRIGVTTAIEGGWRNPQTGLWYENRDAWLYSSENPNYVEGSWIKNPNATTAFQVGHFLNGTAQGMAAIASIFNGYNQASQYQMQANASNFMAQQNERNARLMTDNIREINRAAQSDINVMSMETTQRKSQQRIAQGASGFKVGAGAYEVLNNNTDFIQQYNASMIMLKAGMQGAEVIRQAGTFRAQAIMNRAEADIARSNKTTAILQGWVNGVAGAAAAGASFYVGRWGTQ